MNLRESWRRVAGAERNIGRLARRLGGVVNILFCSVPFRPSIGGIETVSALLADRFHRAGHQVVLVTQTTSDSADTDAFEIVRRPRAARLASLVTWADVVFHNNVSLRFAWPQLLVRRPWVVAHHTWIPTAGLAARVKRRVLGRASNISVSRSIAASLPVASTIVPNPYADDLFVRTDLLARAGDLVFVGRLVSDKGVDRLLDALALLVERRHDITLTVVGDGPEAASLRDRAEQLGVQDRVRFVGRRTGTELVAILNAHRILVVPSVWEEPFGVVVLEAMACGCVPVVSRSGGLPEAVGDCGVVVDRASPVALADGIARLLTDAGALERFRAFAPEHLARHSPDRIAQDYLGVIARAHASARR